MNSLKFIETIKILDGKIYNLPLHQKRMERTMQYHFGGDIFPRLDERISIPSGLESGLIKCRVLYSNDLLSVDFQEYKFREIEYLKLLVSDDIEYSFKSENRLIFNTLSSELKVGKEALIVKKGMISDTTFSNVVLQNEEGFFTPSTPLLRGVKRESLLTEGVIKERKIRVEDLNEYSKIYLINAMIDIEDEVVVDISNVIL